MNALLQLETANISGFQSLKIARLKCALPDDLNIYVSWQIMIPPYYHKYWE